MSAVKEQLLRRAAWPLAVTMLVTMPGAGHAASSARTRMLTPVLASAPHLAGPLRILAAYGIPTSARRSVEHNRRVGGAANSYHLRGHAIDVQRHPGVTHQALDAALRRAGYVLAESIDEIDHSHFAFLDSGRITRPVVASVSVVPIRKSPSLPRIAADDHGTLLVDGRPSSSK